MRCTRSSGSPFGGGKRSKALVRARNKRYITLFCLFHNLKVGTIKIRSYFFFFLIKISKIQQIEKIEKIMIVTSFTLQYTYRKILNLGITIEIINILKNWKIRPNYFLIILKILKNCSIFIFRGTQFGRARIWNLTFPRAETLIFIEITDDFNETRVLGKKLFY